WTPSRWPPWGAGTALPTRGRPGRPLGGDHRGAAAEKSIEHNLAAGRAVEDRVGDHRHRFDRRVERQEIALRAATGEGVDPGILPNIGAVAVKLPELDIVAV